MRRSFCERFNRCDSTVLEKSHQHHRLVYVGHSHSIDEEIFEVREGHLRCLINFHIHRIRTMGEISRNPKRNNFKNNWRYSIRILCLSLQGLVMNQTTISNNPPKIKFLPTSFRPNSLRPVRLISAGAKFSGNQTWNRFPVGLSISDPSQKSDV